MRWAVVVPVKRLAVAKSRLAEVPPALRAELALAMALDTVDAALACNVVDFVVAVSDDPAAVGALTEIGALVVPDEPDAGLNPAVRHGATVAAGRHPEAGIGALSADLPALRAAALGRALQLAAEHPHAFVADAAGTGTTLLTARTGAALVPAYGADSRNRHLAAGAIEIEAAGLDALRRDVDTLADLRAAVTLGLGSRTAALLRRLPSD